MNTTSSNLGENGSTTERIPEDTIMVNDIQGFWIEIDTSAFFLLEDKLTFPPGTNVYANISLSQVNTSFADNPKFNAEAFISSWTFFQADGTESAPQGGIGKFTNSAIRMDDCASIVFTLAGTGVTAIAQINVFRF
jgi:hypothetical protein